MDKSELESKSLAELHARAAEAGVERYRMLPRGELIAALADSGDAPSEPKPRRESGREPSRRGGRGRGSREAAGRERGERGSRGGREGQRRERKPREPRPRERRPEAEPPPEAPLTQQPTAATTPEPVVAAPDKPKRKRRRRWGRRRKGIRVHDLLLPASGRRAIVYAETREGCTGLLRELAAELAGASAGPDPIALLIDPSPEELAEWKREAPQAELVAAGQARHAEDALAQATLRANGGEDVIVLIDSLTRFAEGFAGPDEARALFDAGLDAANGTLTVVAALERSS